METCSGAWKFRVFATQLLPMGPDSGCGSGLKELRNIATNEAERKGDVVANSAEDNTDLVQTGEDFADLFKHAMLEDNEEITVG